MIVLALDDDMGVLLYVQTILGSISKISKVYTARNAKEFGIKLNNHKPDLIISDIMMNPTEGPDIMRKYKDLVGNTPIVLTSCSDDLLQVEDDLLEERFNIVASFYKPVLPITFVEFFND